MKLICALSVMLLSFSAMAEVTDVIRWKPKDKVSHDQVVAAVKQLKAISGDVKGLISKKTYYDSSTKSWIDIVVWQDRASANAFEESNKSKPELEEIGKVIDFDSVTTSSYEEVQ